MGKGNLADMLTRGMPTENFGHNALWWKGTIWLSLNPDTWSRAETFQDPKRLLELGSRGTIYCSADILSEPILDAYTAIGCGQ